MKAIITDFTVHSIIVLLDRLKRLKELKTFLLSPTKSITEEVKAIEISEEKKLDMDDAIQYSVALSLKRKL